MPIPAALAQLLASEALTEDAAGEIAARLAGTGLENLFDESGEATIPVSSAAIRSIGFNVLTDVLTVEFNKRGTFHYNSSLEQFIAFFGASSKGRYFNEHIR